MTQARLRQKLVIAGKILAAAGQGDFTRGHISVRLPGNRSLFLMKPHSVGLDEVTPKNILTIDLDGKVVSGTTGRRHSEVFIHSEIYKARADVHCVIHTHPSHAIAFSALGRPMKAYSQPGALFHNAIGTYADSIALIRDPQTGSRVAQALGRHRAVLLKSHGVVVAAQTVEETVVCAIMLETAAMIQLMVETAGKPEPEFPPEDVEVLKQQISKSEQFQINFDYLARRVKHMRR